MGQHLQRAWPGEHAGIAVSGDDLLRLWAWESKGFHLRSYRDGDLTVGEFTPRAEYDNGFGFLNGGIITTLLDCHGAAAVVWEATTGVAR